MNKLSNHETYKEILDKEYKDRILCRIHNILYSEYPSKEFYSLNVIAEDEEVQVHELHKYIETQSKLVLLTRTGVRWPEQIEDKLFHLIRRHINVNTV